METATASSLPLLLYSCLPSFPWQIKVSVTIQSSSPTFTLTDLIAREAVAHSAAFVVLGAAPQRKGFLNLPLNLG